jgi:hypothetical protein
VILFKSYHIFPIVCEDPAIQKTETRRAWKKDRALVGSTHQCKTNFYDPCFAKVEILDVYQQPLGEMTTSACRAEGGYSCGGEYTRLWQIINKEPLNPLEEVHVIEMECTEMNLTPSEVEKYETMYRMHMAALRGRPV